MLIDLRRLFHEGSNRKESLDRVKTCRPYVLISSLKLYLGLSGKEQQQQDPLLDLGLAVAAG